MTKYTPETDKLSRLIAQSDRFAGGSVRLPKRAPWLEDFTAELLAFPGRHDDQVDALTQGLAWGREMWSYSGEVQPQGPSAELTGGGPRRLAPCASWLGAAARDSAWNAPFSPAFAPLFAPQRCRARRGPASDFIGLPAATCCAISPDRPKKGNSAPCFLPVSALLFCFRPNYLSR